ncbi:unnamed protein product [Linum trigynum]|uniref:Uncharacterized protein n=1 Tax=Linum trigynum TaxID=586398 RepID=A0AAV2G6A1_9ROSI
MREKESSIYRHLRTEKFAARQGQDRGRDLQWRDRDLVTLGFWPSGTRRLQADFAVLIHESQPRSSSRSV